MPRHQRPQRLPGLRHTDTMIILLLLLYILIQLVYIYYLLRSRVKMLNLLTRAAALLKETNDH